MCRFAAQSPFAKLVPIEPEHFADVAKPFDMRGVVRKPMAFDVSGRGIDRNADFAAENRPRFLLLFFGGGIDHSLGFQGNEVIGKNGELHDEIDNLGGVRFAQFEPLRIRIPLDHLMGKDSGCQFFAQRGNLFHSFPPRPRLYIEVIKRI